MLGVGGAVDEPQQLLRQAVVLQDGVRDALIEVSSDEVSALIDSTVLAMAGKSPLSRSRARISSTAADDVGMWCRATD